VDKLKGITENFNYDNLNRLISFGESISIYDVKGNLTNKSDIGIFEYNIAQKPYAISDATFVDYNSPLATQEVTYTSFSRPQTITEGGYEAFFNYNSKYDRIRMTLNNDDGDIFYRYYIGGCYELDITPTSTKEKLYLGGNYYNSMAVFVNDNSDKDIYYILRDYLGSITHIVSSKGNLVQELSYDAWGRLRNPDNQQIYGYGEVPELFLGRGYTGHEHLARFGLVNMNARMYDPALCRFLSPDPHVQMPDFSQSLNRYSYCLNNPLKYKDENGELFLGFISGFFRGIFQGKNPFKTGFKAVENELKIYGGLLAFDSRKSFWGKTWELASRFTWQLPQTMVGIGYAKLSNCLWQIDEVNYWGGATIASGNNWGKASAAITIGNYITGGENLEANPNNSLFQHEYGHYLQSQEMGWAFLVRVGIPSLMNAMAENGNHKYQIYEQDANRRAFLYFNKNVSGFYKSYDEMYDVRGWNFKSNPLDIYHTGKGNYYVDYKSQESISLLSNLSLHASWYDFASWIGGPWLAAGAGIGNGIYYANHIIE